MIGEEDALFTFEYEEHFKILPSINDWYLSKARIKDGQRVDEGFSYRSDTNTEWMSDADLADWIKANSAKIGTV